MSATSVTKPALLRYVFWTLWFVLLPGAFAISIVVWCQSSNSALGELGGWVRDQQLPAGIILFTLAEMTFYYFRHSLPFADQTAVGGREGLPKELRPDYEAAAHLLDETQRILSRRAKAIEREIPKATREKLRRNLDALKQTMGNEPFEAESFRSAFDRANGQVDEYLAPWRKSEAREYVESIGVAILIALALRAVVVEAFKIPSGSMLPTLQIDDHIFVNKFIYGPNIPLTQTRVFTNLPPERGDVIVFEFPDTQAGEEAQDFIKRVIVQPGDTLEVDGGHPIINGWRVPSCEVGRYPYGKHDGPSSQYGKLFVEFLGEHTYLTLYEEGGHSGGRLGPFKVKPGEVWVMGDNRFNSHDSRYWNDRAGGGVPYRNIEGRAMSIWFPISRLMTPVNGAPQLPDGMPPELTAGIEKCIAARPANTTPPPPGSEVRK